MRWVARPSLRSHQVLHPFYVFQIASIVLWSIDDYYYYAFAIAVISIASVLSTLIETKRTIERMREMSKFHADVKILIDGECELTRRLSADPRDGQRLRRHGPGRHLRRFRP